jgi:hypothetical protein
MFPIVHASLALLDLLSILQRGRCLTMVGTEGGVTSYLFYAADQLDLGLGSSNERPHCSSPSAAAGPTDITWRS